jgi:two-component sensor histidine kinase
MELNMVSYLGVPIRWPDGEVFGTFCVLDNKRNEYSTDQRQLVERLAELVENDLKTLQDMTDRLTQAELRAKEIRHRITNQFNMLVSYIDLHVGFGSQEPLSIVKSMRARIETLATIHRQMSALQSSSRASLLGYLSEIATLLVSSAPFDVSVTVHGDDLLVDEETLVPLVSIVNELVTNSVKHAFHGVPHPSVELTSRREGERFCVEYSDNGRWTDPPPATGSGLGEMIIEGLASQLSASIERDGYDARICFPMPQY